MTSCYWELLYNVHDIVFTICLTRCWQEWKHPWTGPAADEECGQVDPGHPRRKWLCQHCGGRRTLLWISAVREESLAAECALQAVVVEVGRWGGNIVDSQFSDWLLLPGSCFGWSMSSTVPWTSCLLWHGKAMRMGSMFDLRGAGFVLLDKSWDVVKWQKSMWELEFLLVSQTALAKLWEVKIHVYFSNCLGKIMGGENLCLFP